MKRSTKLQTKTNYSVIIPAYNAEKTIVEAIASVLAQEVPATEIIVVDDGSKDETVKRVKEMGADITIISQANQGPGAATNAGIEIASQPLLAFLDADDVWLPNKMTHQINYLQANSVDAVFSQAVNFRGDLQNPIKLDIKNFWSRTTMVITSEAAEKIGKIIDPIGNRGDIVDWLARARDMGMKLELIPEVLAMRRICPGSLSYGIEPDKDKGYLIAIKNSLDRKRKMQK